MKGKILLICLSMVDLSNAIYVSSVRLAGNPFVLYADSFFYSGPQLRKKIADFYELPIEDENRIKVLYNGQQISLEGILPEEINGIRNFDLVAVLGKREDSPVLAKRLQLFAIWDEKIRKIETERLVFEETLKSLSPEDQLPLIELKLAELLG